MGGERRGGRNQHDEYRGELGVVVEEGEEGGGEK